MTNDERHRQHRTPNVLLLLVQRCSAWATADLEIAISTIQEALKEVKLETTLKPATRRTKPEPEPEPDQRVTRFASTSDQDPGFAVSRLAVTPSRKAKRIRARPA